MLRLKGGDPNIFGRGGEEALALARAGVPFRVLPGVTSAFGALADARIPATRRGVSKALILATGHAVGTADDLDWAALARTGQPIVIYMGLAAIGGDRRGADRGRARAGDAGGGDRLGDDARGADPRRRPRQHRGAGRRPRASGRRR